MAPLTLVLPIHTPLTFFYATVVVRHLQLMQARAEAVSLRSGKEASSLEERRLAKALEDASTARSALLPRLRDSQVIYNYATTGGTDVNRSIIVYENEKYI